MVDIRVPTLGESVTEATVGKWFKQPGDSVAVDEPLVELETDKVTLEVPAPAAGVLADIAVKDGATVAVGALLGQIKEGAGAVPKAPSATATKPAASPTGAPDEKTTTTKPIGAGPEQPQPREMPMPPSVRKMAAESGVDPSKIAGSGLQARLELQDLSTTVSDPPEPDSEPNWVVWTAAKAPPLLRTVSTYSRCSIDSGVSSASSVMPMMPFIGVRIS